ncbi:MAG: hypothetical protein ACRDTF_22910 [Pseudonocardiaceae bacterium]
MSNVEEVRWRLLGEQVGKVYRAVQSQAPEPLPEGSPPDQNTEILLRMAGAVLALLDWHAIDSKGRCWARGCARRRWLPWRKRRTCHVFATVHFWMRQPLSIVQKTGENW